MAIRSFGAEGAFASQFTIDITHVPTENSVSFYAFLNSFSDSFKGSYKTQNVYGRMDPIVNYQGTTRKLSFSFTVPAFSFEDAEENVAKMQRLIKFQYPTYNRATEKTGNTVTSTLNVSGMAAPPICTVRFKNLINYNGEELYGYFDGVDFTPTNESGYFTDDGRIFPKEFKVTLGFNVLHTSPLGWDASTNLWASITENESAEQSAQFPYGASGRQDRADIATANANSDSAYADLADARAAANYSSTSPVAAAREQKLQGR